MNLFINRHVIYFGSFICEYLIINDEWYLIRIMNMYIPVIYLAGLLVCII